MTEVGIGLCSLPYGFIVNKLQHILLQESCGGAGIQARLEHDSLWIHLRAGPLMPVMPLVHSTVGRDG